MVICAPIPSMPIYFWGDKDRERYMDSYFKTYPGCWRHGDWVLINARGSAVILGRSNAKLNRHGVRISTAEIYRVLDEIPRIRDALIVNVERSDGDSYMPLFVLMDEGEQLDDGVKEVIRTRLKAVCSPRHLPDAIIAVAAIPYTLVVKRWKPR